MRQEDFWNTAGDGKKKNKEEEEDFYNNTGILPRWKTRCVFPGHSGEAVCSLAPKRDPELGQKTRGEISHL